MIKWIENYYKREDGRFMRIVQDTDYAEKHLADLYRARKTISIAGPLWILFMFLVTVVLPSNSDSGLFFGSVTMGLFLYTAIDMQIKMILMINYIKSTFKLENSTSHKQSEGD